MTKCSEEEIRRKIYDFISHNSGLHLSKIAERLNMKISEVDYHLKYLKQSGALFVTKEAGYERYFIEKRKVKTRSKRTLETRMRIYDVVAQNPGLHLSKIAEMLNMSVPLTDYHLNSMQRKGDIVILKDAAGYYKRYYVEGSEVKSQEKKILEILRKKIPLKIVLYLLKYPALKHKDILDKFEISSSTLSYHLTRLVDIGILDVHPHGAEKGYVLRNKDEIVKILKKYELNIELHLTADDFKDMWDDLSYKDSLG